jgi:uncharacterized Zn finger protein (UPF0148 family)
MVDSEQSQMSRLNRIFHHAKRGQLICPICNEPVCLETSKTDEDGRATHEECYVQRTLAKLAAEKKVFPRPVDHPRKTGTSN